jgi:hypothetical protein
MKCEIVMASSNQPPFKSSGTFSNSTTIIASKETTPRRLRLLFAVSGRVQADALPVPEAGSKMGLLPDGKRTSARQWFAIAAPSSFALQEILRDS